MRDLIFYSLATNSGKNRHLDQLQQSVRTICLHNPGTTVIIFTLNSKVPPQKKREFEKAGAEIVHLGSYLRLLQKFAPSRAKYLVEYPTLHKYFGLSLSSNQKFDRYLYLDCDTFCFQNLEQIMPRSLNWDLIAREEPYTKGSPLGENKMYFDSSKLGILAKSYRCGPIRPFNAGAVLMNRKTIKYFASQQAKFLEIVFQLSVQIARQVVFEKRSFPSELPPEIHYLIKNIHSPDIKNVKSTGPYPTQNIWIREQVAMWLVLAQKNFKLRLFNQKRVLQGREFMDLEDSENLPPLVHYYSANMNLFFKVFLKDVAEATSLNIS